MSRTNRSQAMELLSELQENGVSAESMLHFILTYSLSGEDALYAMRDVKAEFLDEEDYEEDNSHKYDDEEDYNSGLLYGVDNNQ